MEKLIISDVDIVYRTSLESLYRQFSEFSPEQLFSFAPDLSPHYHSMTQVHDTQYRLL